MKTILHVIDTTGPGGAETVYLDLVRGLDRTRYRNVVTTGVPDGRDRSAEGISRHGWLYDRLLAAGIDPVVLPTTRAFDVGYLARLVAAARRERADVIHSHLLTPNVYCSAAGLLTGIPVVATFHGTVDINPQSRLSRAKLGIINRGAAKLAFVSDALRRAVLGSTRLDPSKAVVVHNGIDTARFHPAKNDRLRAELGWQDAGMIAGAVGNLRRAKAYDVLLDAAALVAAQEPSMRFVIAGDDTDGLKAGLEAQCARLGLERAVRFIGFGRDVPELLNGLDVFVLSSRTEGFSLVTVEAMACALPVVATRSGGPEEIVEDGRSGLMVGTEAPDQLAAALLRLGADAGLRAELSARALQRAREQFDVSAMVRRYEAVYDAL